LAWGILVSGVLWTGVWGLRKAEAHLLGPDRFGQVTAIEVRLVDCPPWMPTRVARRIQASCFPEGLGFYDDALTAAVYRRAAANAWVRQVRSVRKYVRAGGTEGVIDVRCDYRRPVACVETTSGFAAATDRDVYVDADGVRLPHADVPKYAVRFTGMDGRHHEETFASSQAVPPHSEVWRIEYPVIRGIASATPANGRRWDAGDLAAGLRLLALLADRPYANQITVVDVRNHDGRLAPDEAHLRMLAQVGQGRPTRILFGRFPKGMVDVVVSPQRKLSYLDWYVSREDNEAGLLAGLDEELDLRYDRLYGPEY